MSGRAPAPAHRDGPMTSSTVQITLNGETKRVPAGTTVAQLVEQLGLLPSRFAVEVDRRIVPRSEHDRHALRGGERVEVVTFVGGG